MDVGGGDEVDVLEDEVDEAVDEFGCYLVCLVFEREVLLVCFVFVLMIVDCKNG